MTKGGRYIPRIADERLAFLLSSCGAVHIKGPKWCGKSTTAEKQSNSVVYLQDRGSQDQNIMLARNAPELFLKGDVPKLIDEWQTIPFIWDSVRFEVDKRGEFGQFILTGSSVPPDDSDIGHSGAGRIVPMIMRTMSLYESGESDGSISLSKLFNSLPQSPSESRLSLEDYSYLICRGGWPMAATQTDRRIALQQAKNYYSVLVDEDIQRLGKIKRNGMKIRSVLRSYARNVASNASFKTIRDDILEHSESTIDRDTVAKYIDDLEKLYVVEELPAWCPNLRNKATVNTSDTRHFVDPSIGCAALDINPPDLISDLNTMGLYFESLAVRDLRVYSEKIGGSVFHYRDSDGLEADAIIKLADGRWAALEMKLCDSERIDEGAKHLIKLKDSIDTEKHRQPEFLMVVSATNYAYQRPDGVWVVPLGCLGP